MPRCLLSEPLFSLSISKEIWRVFILRLQCMFIRFSTLIFFRGFVRDFVIAFIVRMSVNIWKVERFKKFYHVQFPLV